MPDWWLLQRAARFLGVAPWELEQQPIFYRNCALEALSAENWAEAERAKRERKRGRRK